MDSFIYVAYRTGAGFLRAGETHISTIRGWAPLVMTRTPQLEDGFVRIANELLEAILGFDLSHREQSVVLTIIRKTYGYGKKEDDISAAQIGDMCGIARTHVTNALNQLAQRNVITKRTGRFGSIIGIQKDHRKWISQQQLKSIGASTESVQGCTELVHVPNQYVASTESVQVDSTESVHTKDNLPKDNHQKKSSCAPLGEIDPEIAIPAGRLGRATTDAKAELQNRFERFYAAYPKKRSRQATGVASFMQKEILTNKLRAFADFAMSNPATAPLIDTRELLNQTWDAMEIGKESPILKEEGEQEIPPQVQQQMQALQEQVKQMGEALNNAHAEVQKLEAEQEIKEREIAVKEQDSDTKRMAVVAPAMTPEEIEALVMQTIERLMAAPPLGEPAPRTPEESQAIMDFHDHMMQAPGEPPGEAPPAGAPQMEEQPPEAAIFLPAETAPVADEGMPQ